MLELLVALGYDRRYRKMEETDSKFIYLAQNGKSTGWGTKEKETERTQEKEIN